MQGRLSKKGKVQEKLTTVALTNFVPSIYFMKIIQDNKEVKVFKIIKD